MTRTLLLVPERSAGWQMRGTVPLINEPECAAYGALVGAGLSVGVMGIPHFLDGQESSEDRLAIVVRPEDEILESLERKMRRTGGTLLAVQDQRTNGNNDALRMVRRIQGQSVPLSLNVSLTSRNRAGFRRLLRLPRRTILRPGPGDEVVARWGKRGSPSILRRREGRSWILGFPLDRLDHAGLASLLGILAPSFPTLSTPIAALPEGARAVVLLLHDVEQALPGDPRGTQSVRDGLEACLEAQAKHSYHATYNLVGSFAEEIPDLVRRIGSDGHEIASHSATHRVVADLGPADLQEEIEGAEKRITPLSGKGIVGFRSPRSRWSVALLDVLQSRGYLWSAEADMSPFPYSVPRGYSRTLLRIPVAVDDWDYVKRSATPSAMNRLWKGEVRRAIEMGCWVGIGSHPSVLGFRTERMSAFAEFLDWLSGEKVKVMTMSEGAKWWLKRAGAVEDLPVAAEGTRVSS